jgi:hypothetical protein
MSSSDRVLSPDPLLRHHPYGCIVVVRSGVGCHFARKIVRTKRGRLGIGAERELQHRHAGKSELFPDRFHFGRDHSQVFGHERQLAQLRLRGTKQGRSRTLHPLPFTAVGSDAGTSQ